MIRAKRLLAGVAVALASAIAPLAERTARAQEPDGGVFVPTCDDPVNVGTDAIYVIGPTIFRPAIAALGAQVWGSAGANHATLVHIGGPNTCDGVEALENNADISATARFFRPDGNAIREVTCLVPFGTKPDVAVADVSYETCAGSPPADIGDVLGPVQPIVFVVPKASKSFSAVSAEEAQLIFGCGLQGMVSPFGDEAGLANLLAGSQSILGKYLDITRFKGQPATTPLDLVTKLRMYAAGNPDKAMGYMPADAYEASRAFVKSLAFRGFDQRLAYYPDSTATAVDRRNVRDGHYLPWGSLHSIVRLGADGKPSNPKAAKWLAWLDGSAKISGFSIEQATAMAGSIPRCAMKVTRTSEGGLLQPYAAPDPCGCYYEAAVTKVARPPGCVSCSTDAMCSGGKKCHHFYCE